jgi:hypothetical protein
MPCCTFAVNTSIDLYPIDRPAPRARCVMHRASSERASKATKHRRMSAFSESTVQRCCTGDARELRRITARRAALRSLEAPPFWP